jgi:predicted  nucleic acid-binding Zn-ribbon protein
MHPDLHALAAADTEERQIKASDRAIEVATERLAAARKAVAAAEASERAAAAALGATREAERVLQREIEGYRASRQAAIRALEAGAGNPEASERQRQKSEALIDEAETRALENLEAQDPLRAALGAAEKALGSARATLALAESEVPGELERQAAARARYLAARDQALTPLDRETRQRYLTLVGRKGTAVAYARNGSCSACQMTVYQQHVTDLLRGIIEPCKGCGRWLIPPEPATR